MWEATELIELWEQVEIKLSNYEDEAGRSKREMEHLRLQRTQVIEMRKMDDLKEQ